MFLVSLSCSAVVSLPHSQHWPFPSSHAKQKGSTPAPPSPLPSRTLLLFTYRGPYYETRHFAASDCEDLLLIVSKTLRAQLCESRRPSIPAHPFKPCTADTPELSCHASSSPRLPQRVRSRTAGRISPSCARERKKERKKERERDFGSSRLLAETHPPWVGGLSPRRRPRVLERVASSICRDSPRLPNLSPCTSPPPSEPLPS